MQRVCPARPLPRAHTVNSALPPFSPQAEGPAPNVAPILEAIRMAPSSFGIQPYKVHVVTAAATKEALMPVCYGQAQVGQASHVLVFTAAKDCAAMGERYIAANKLDEFNPGYAGMIRGSMGGIAKAGASEAWAAKQAYIALGFGLAAAVSFARHRHLLAALRALNRFPPKTLSQQAELRIPSCPMEGFDAAAVGTILAIPDTHFVAVVLAVGRAHADEKAATGGYPQFRFPEAELISVL